jgi:hypothetical protein
MRSEMMRPYWMFSSVAMKFPTLSENPSASPTPAASRRAAMSSAAIQRAWPASM